MAPPTYADLGKTARDVFSKGYNFGFVKVETTTKSSIGQDVEFKTGAAHNLASSNLAGNIDIKYNLRKYGLTVTEKWNTENILSTELVLQDKGLQGLKLTLNSAYQPAAAKRTGQVKLDFAHDRVRTTIDAPTEASPVVNAAVVTEHEGWLVGASGSFDSSKNQMKNSGLSLGRNFNDYIVNAYVASGWPMFQGNNGSQFGGDLYHRVNSKLELAANLGWASGENNTKFGLAAKYQFSPATVLRGKVSQNSEVAIGMTHELTDSLKLNISALASVANFQEGGHKFGLGLEYIA